MAAVWRSSGVSMGRVSGIVGSVTVSGIAQLGKMKAALSATVGVQDVNLDF